MSCLKAAALEQSQSSKVIDPLKIARAFDGVPVPNEFIGEGQAVLESDFRKYLHDVWSQAMQDCED